MKAYSLDLRQKIIDTYFEGGISQRHLAKRFRLALSFVEKLLKQYREVGNIAPKVCIQQTPMKLNAQQLSILKQTVEANKDATLNELCSHLEQKTGVEVGQTTMDRMLRMMNIKVKKHCTPAKKKVSESNHYG